MKPSHYYFLGTGSWFFSHGIQSVTFAWMVTIVLHESPEKVGIAQTAFLMPAMLFMLFGGSLADQYGGRIVALYGKLLAVLSVLALIVSFVMDNFSYTILLVFAVGMGIAQSLVTPARDGLLALIADGKIQRRVVQVSMMQFGVQMLGFVTASFADQAGAIIILLIQFTVLFLGMAAFKQLQIPETIPSKRDSSLFLHLFQSINTGFQTVRRSSSMLMVVTMNCATGMFFMGSYIVTIPLLLREFYGGTSTQLASLNVANALGLVLTIFCMLRLGDIHRQGRALILSSAFGAIVLATAGLNLGFPALVVSVFLWGMCGGMGMTMARTVMQEQAPPGQRARIMSFFSFSFMGAGPIGALFNGYMVQWFGAATAITSSCCAMLIMVTIIVLKSDLWRLDSRHREPESHAA